MQRRRTRRLSLATLLLAATLAPAAPSRAGEPADINGDGIVGFSDFVLLSRRFGTNDPVGDINGDDQVNFSDFLILTDAYHENGVSPDPSLPRGHLTLIVNDGLEAELRNNGDTTIALLGYSLVTPSGLLSIDDDQVMSGDIILKRRADLDDDGTVGFGDFVRLSRRFNSDDSSLNGSMSNERG